MSASRTTGADAFVLDVMDLDGIAVGRDDDGQLVATRDLTDETVDLEDVLDLADDHGLAVENLQVSIPDGEARVVLGGAD